MILRNFGVSRTANSNRAWHSTPAAAPRASGISQGNAKTEVGRLQSALNQAAKLHHVDRSPRLTRPAKQQSNERILNGSYVRALIMACHNPRIRLSMICLQGKAGH